jgi:chromosome segregation ATPase
MNIEAVIALLGAGGLTTLITLIVSGWFKRGERQMDEASAIRKELRDQSAAVQLRLDTVEKDLDTWKTKYYCLQQQYLTLMSEKEALAQRLASESARKDEKIAAMQKELDTLTAQVKALQAKS